MSTQRDPTTILAAWLDDGPLDLPEATRRAILTALPMTPQARRGPLAAWRFPMNPVTRVAIPALAAVILIAAAVYTFGLTSSPGSGGSQTPAPSPSAVATTSTRPTAPAAVLPALDATFVSPTYGYQVRYPKGWQVTAGSGPWLFNSSSLPHGDARLDQIIAPEGGAFRMRIVAASTALPRGTTLEAFRAFASAPDPRCTPLVSPLPEPVTIDGVQALVSLNGCRSLSELGGNIYDVVVISGSRGYDFTLDGDLSAADALRWLSAIKLEPATAGTPSPS
jgi:hypothetical protein